MPETKRSLKVFLCHAHADRDAVRALYNRLIKDGVDAWLDKEKLLPGQDWELEIRKAVRESDVVVVCLSKQFNQAGFRQKEVRLALDTAMEKPEGEIFIIPARLEECESLESLRKWHWVDLFEGDGYERLMRALRVRADKIGATLQLKKNWLPKNSFSRSNVETVIEQRTVEANNDMPEELQKKDEGRAQNTLKEQEKNEAAEKAAQEKAEKEIRHRLEKSIKKAKRDLWWEKLKMDIRYRLQLIWIYRAPILILLVTFAIIAPLLIRLSKLTPEINSAINNIPTTTVGLSITPQQDFTSTESLILTSSFTPNSKPTEKIISTSLPTEITDAKGVKMELVPAGDFTMGSNSGNADEQPAHTVFLDAFYMDKYEVTNALYKACVDAGGCKLPQKTSSYNRLSYYGNLEFSDYPVVYVNWEQANNYCKWRGGVLPTEAQWEKAARGTDGRTYPWGGESACFRANSFGCGSFETKVGSYEGGKSPYGIYDMAGNVQEWVANWYGADYYANSPASNPLGPNLGQYRVLRGGSYFGDVRATYRNFSVPIYNQSDTGFRCAFSTP